MKREDNGTILIASEATIFLAVLAVLSLDELLDLPAMLFGDTPSFYRVSEFLMEAALIGILGLVSLWITLVLLRRARHAESFLRVCGWCKKISVEYHWIPFEDYIAKTYHTQSSHGICEGCKARLLHEAHERKARRDEA